MALMVFSYQEADLGRTPRSTTVVMCIDALCQASVFARWISATVALVFLAAKQGPFLRQPERGKIPYYSGRQAGLLPSPASQLCKRNAYDPHSPLLSTFFSFKIYTFCFSSFFCRAVNLTM